MKASETKTIYKLLLCVGLLFFTCPFFGSATDYNSANFTVKDPVVDGGQKTSSSTNYGLGQSVGQTAIGRSSSASFQLWSGFQYYYKANANSLSATSGNGSVALSWTVPQTFLGMTITGYEVGTGTVSGTYVFEDAGNATSFAKSGLTNGTQYFFRVKAKGPGGIFVVFSNEASATPTGGTPPSNGGGGGGGGGGGVASIILSGLAYPGRSVIVLKDGAVAATVQSDAGANFNVTLNNINAGIYSFSLYAEDTDGQRSPTLSFFQSVTAGVTTKVENLFLGPTIGVSAATIKQGETLNIFGYTAPASEVSVFVNSPQQFIEKITSSTSGRYFKAFNTTPLELGDHSTKSQTSKGDLLSPYSTAVAFKVGDKTEPIEKDCRRSDLNCDGLVNLTDFSILLFYWRQASPANPRADINKSGLVDLTDFSIMLYDWTG